MNDMSPSDDELVSSYLDGEASPEEVARVEADPGLLARVEEMRAAIELTATPVPIPDLDLARIRATAVAASDTSPAVRDLQAAGADRRRRHQQRTRMLAIAAAFLFLGIAVTGIRSLDGGTDTDTAGTASSAITADAVSGDDADNDASDDSGGLDALGGADASDEEERELASEAAPLAEAASAATEADDAVDDADAGGADSTQGDDAGDDADLGIPQPDFRRPFFEFDVLPELLDPSPDLDALHVQIRAIAAAFVADGEPTLPERDDPIDVPCIDDFIILLNDLDFAAADFALADLAGDDMVVVVARDQAGAMFALTAFTGACGNIQIEPLLPLG